MSSKYLLILLPLVFGDLRKCDNYLYDNLMENKCSSAEVNGTEMTYRLKKCEKKQYCSYSFPLASDKPDKCSGELPKRYIGEYCTNNNECHSNNCEPVRKTCTTSSTECKEHGDCDVGLYCSTDNKCVLLETKGQTCDATKKCHVNLICNNGICTEVGSINESESATVPAACKTFYIAGKKCQEGPKLQNESKLCSKDNDKCIYKDYKNQYIEEKCQCGITAEGKSYCSPGIGDMNMKDVFLNIYY